MVIALGFQMRWGVGPFWRFLRDIAAGYLETYFFFQMAFFGPCFFFKGLALPWFGSPLEEFLKVLAFSGFWLFAPRTKERNKQTKNKRKI